MGSSYCLTNPILEKKIQKFNENYNDDDDDDDDDDDNESTL